VRAIATDIDGVVVIEPDVHADARGFLYESWNRRRFADAVGQDVEFVQDNHSRSATGVIRGIHYQVAPRVQGKLVRVTAGAVFDVAVDLRRSSPTCGRWVGFELSADNRLQMWIPPGFGHAFLALSDGADVLYKTTDYYAGECARGIAWNDPDIGVDWPLRVPPVLSTQDAGAPGLGTAELFE
jgi:dTDP-4-dehydrorhamnose 3,5-epimerase